ncbi:MAG: PIN domain-containing protein [Imperialibacter sp.]|uniref:type II toxin-antitoxin system VapC family toxin n=1 Tax=Imperialibacter sp. TaxID=2038411 RepID=UPI0032EC27A6
MRILFDTNIILDIALKRPPFFTDSSEAFKSVDQQKVFGYISATSVTDIYYVARKSIGHDTSILFIEDLLDILDVVGIDRSVIKHALQLNFRDFEDAIQSVSAKLNDIDYVITRNISDFTKSEVTAITPDAFLKKLL